PGGEWEEGAARGGESRVPLWRAVSSRGLHCDQPGNGQPGGGAVLQQARDCRAVDQGGQAGGKDDPAELPSVSVQRGAPMAEPDRLQPGQLVATAGAAEEDRELVADQLAAATGEDGRAVGEACPLLLVDAGREPSDAAPVWKHG